MSYSINLHSNCFGHCLTHCAYERHTIPHSLFRCSSRWIICTKLTNNQLSCFHIEKGCWQRRWCFRSWSLPSYENRQHATLPDQHGDQPDYSPSKVMLRVILALNNTNPDVGRPLFICQQDCGHYEIDSVHVLSTLRFVYGHNLWALLCSVLSTNLAAVGTDANWIFFTCCVSAKPGWVDEWNTLASRTDSDLIEWLRSLSIWCDDDDEWWRSVGWDVT